MRLESMPTRNETMITTATTPIPAEGFLVSSFFFSLTERIIMVPAQARKTENAPRRRFVGAWLLSNASRMEPTIVPGRNMKQNLKSTSLFHADATAQQRRSPS